MLYYYIYFVWTRSLQETVYKLRNYQINHMRICALLVTIASCVRYLLMYLPHKSNSCKEAEGKPDGQVDNLVKVLFLNYCVTLGRNRMILNWGRLSLWCKQSLWCIVWYVCKYQLRKGEVKQPSGKDWRHKGAQPDFTTSRSYILILIYLN